MVPEPQSDIGETPNLSHPLIFSFKLPMINFFFISVTLFRIAAPAANAITVHFHLLIALICLNHPTKIFLGMAAMPFPLWCSFDIEDDSLA